MSLSVIERIARELVDRLDDVTAANGYASVITEVVRPRAAGGYTPADGLCVVHQLDPEGVPELSPAGNPPATAWRQPFNISVYIMPADSDETEIESLINAFAADVVAAVCTPIATWHNFADDTSTTAINAEWGAQTTMHDEQGVANGFTLPLYVTYRTDENNLTVVR